MADSQLRAAVVGTGPAGLMAATKLLEQGASVDIYERRAGLGRKLLIAGSSGLNISHDAPLEDFLAHYERPEVREAVRAFPPADWLGFVESLGHRTFKGTSKRWFVEEMKASGLLQSWTQLLKSKGAVFFAEHELVSIEGGGKLKFFHRGVPIDKQYDRAVLALGGGSWENPPPAWPALFSSLGLKMIPFTAGNVGYEIDFPEALLKEAEGKPIKNCLLRTALGEKRGELVITRYGIEGTPVYFVGTSGEARLNLRPDVSRERLVETLRARLKENLSPVRRLKKLGGLSEGAFALFFHLTPPSLRESIEAVAERVQSFPLHLLRPRPLEEAISSRGGLSWDEVGPDLEFKNMSQVYAAGEMLDWHAPTGGFLIQACVSLGAWAGARAGTRAGARAAGRPL